MSFFEIPLDPSYDAQESTVKLDNVQYIVRFTLNQRAQFWCMDLLTDAGEPIVLGAPLYPKWMPFRQYRDPRLPAGRIFVLDHGDPLKPVTRWDYGPGRRVHVLYEGKNAL